MKHISLLLLLFVYAFSYDAFIKPQELKTLLQNKELIILDVGSRESYKKSHIQNAVHVDVSKFSNKSTYSLQSSLRKLGINFDSHIVLYSHNTQKGFLNSSYFAYLCMSHGFENISILDGGYMAWLFENELLTSNIPSFAKKYGNVELKKNSSFFVDSDYLQSALGKVSILDSRSPRHYYGVEKSDSIKAVGHIPHAKSSFYKDKFFTDETLKPTSQLHEIFISGHGLQSDDEIIVYGADIFDASMNWYILYKYMGFKNTKIYEASFFEWGNNSGLPVTRYKWETK
ncbi:thiosulfate sulfurtransferase [bacterium]|nr:thiosulfate sulfurtransferase [bacterium]MBU1989194.1 thiosulfate sulfurtransferase [bacterium]